MGAIIGGAAAGGLLILIVGGGYAWVRFRRYRRRFTLYRKRKQGRFGRFIGRAGGRPHVSAASGTGTLFQDAEKGGGGGGGFLGGVLGWFSNLTTSTEQAERFCARSLVLGQPEVAAAGLKVALGLSDDLLLSTLLSKGIDEIVNEFKACGSQEDLENLCACRHELLAPPACMQPPRAACATSMHAAATSCLCLPPACMHTLYVHNAASLPSAVCVARHSEYCLNGVAGKPDDLPAHVRRSLETGFYHGGRLAEDDFDYGHHGMTLDDFVKHKHARVAELSRANVLALRLYTTSSFPKFNGPLRAGACPHPLKMTVYYLAEVRASPKCMRMRRMLTLRSACACVHVYVCVGRRVCARAACVCVRVCRG